MPNTLPKGHLSCLSNAFRYTPAVSTNVADTFARIKRQLKEQETSGSASSEQMGPLTVSGSRPFPAAAIESAWRLVRAGGFRSTPRLVHSREG